MVRQAQSGCIHTHVEVDTDQHVSSTPVAIETAQATYCTNNIIALMTNVGWGGI